VRYTSTMGPRRGVRCGAGHLIGVVGAGAR
jgi:hypothetical protein